MAAPSANMRPLIIKKKKKGHGHGHHGGAWKIAYADFTTAMMAFFLMLWLVSNPEKAALRGLADYFEGSAPSPLSGGNGGAGSGSGGNGSVNGETGSPVAGGPPAPGSQGARLANGAEARVPDATQRIRADELKIALEAVAVQAGVKDSVSVTSREDGIRIELMDTAQRPMFRAGTADLFPYARALIAGTAKKLGGDAQRLAIEGHTDSVGGYAPANWRISGERALIAMQVLTSTGIRPDRIQSVSGRAGSEPAFPDQPERAENRRITIVLIAEAPATPRTVGFVG